MSKGKYNLVDYRTNENLSGMISDKLIAESLDPSVPGGIVKAYYHEIGVWVWVEPSDPCGTHAVWVEEV